MGRKLANFIASIPKRPSVVVGDNMLFFLTNNLAFAIINEVDILNIAIILSALEEEPESEDEEEDTKIGNASTKRPASGGGAKTPQVYTQSGCRVLLCFSICSALEVSSYLLNK